MENTTADAQAIPAHGSHDEVQLHPLKSYFIVWGWLFVLSAASYMVDYSGIQGFPRWTLILIFMMAKATLIVAFFMHFRWERLALTYAMLLPTLAVLAFVAIMAFEASYTLFTRAEYFSPVEQPTGH